MLQAKLLHSFRDLAVRLRLEEERQRAGVQSLMERPHIVIPAPRDGLRAVRSGMGRCRKNMASLRIIPSYPVARAAALTREK